MKFSILAFSSFIFVKSLLFCLLPLVIKEKRVIKKIYPYINVVAAGFMLALMLLDFIPHLVNGHDHSHAHGHGHGHAHDTHCGFFERFGRTIKSNAGLIIGGVTFIILLGIDSLVLKHKHCETDELEKHCSDKHKAGQAHEKLGSCNIDAIVTSTNRTQAIIFLLSISVHSFFEGLALGYSGMGSREVGICIHKMLESLSIGFTVFSAPFGRAFNIFLCTLYSALTPLGIALSGTLHNQKHVQRVFDGLAFGSILFIVCVEMIPPSFHNQKDSALKVVMLATGFALTGMVICATHHC